MSRALLKNALPLLRRLPLGLLRSPLPQPPPPLLSSLHLSPKTPPNLTADPFRRLYSADHGADADADAKPPKSLAEAAREAGIPFEDVSNAEFKRRIELYFKGDEDVLPSIFEAILNRKLSGKHEESDTELMDELRMEPLKEVGDQEFEDDMEEMHETDEEIDNLYDAGEYVRKKLSSDEFFNMDDKKWDDMISESMEHGHLKDTKECEGILEDMLKWDKLLPVEIQKKVRHMYLKLEDMIESKEIEPEPAYEIYRKFEDKIVEEHLAMTEEELEDAESGVIDNNVELDDPPGEGPILRWVSRIVFCPGGDAWHPKNRKVKLSVTVKELGLSRNAFLRLREIVGKRYHPGRDELTIVSERFEHREENRKDCLRTLYALIEEAAKADKLVDEARKDYMKDKLRADPQFMERLKAKVTGAGHSLPKDFGRRT